MNRWSRRPEGSNWGEFGANDQIGRLNLITPGRRLAAMREVRDGIAFCLSLPLDLPGPESQPPFRRPPCLEWNVPHDSRLADLFKVEGAVDVGNDDRVTLHLQYSTQWDSLAHIGALFDADGDGVPEPRYYNGYQPESGPRGIGSLGIEHMAATAVQGRGILVNLLKVFGRTRKRVDCDALLSVFSRQRIVVEPGDILCLYTGYADAVMATEGKRQTEWPEEAFAALDAHDPRLLQWITDSGVAAICADNGAVEAKPAGHEDGTAHCAPGAPFLPLHHHCLFKLGIHLGELWYLRELAEHLDSQGRYRFLLTAPPLRLPGAVGSPAMPVGTV
jgi:kynurenine formamidase